LSPKTAEAWVESAVPRPTAAGRPLRLWHLALLGLLISVCYVSWLWLLEHT
jgi:hypothetical protein